MPVPELLRVARTVEGEPRDVLGQLLHLLCEQTGADVAFVATDADGVRTVELAVAADAETTVFAPLDPAGSGQYLGAALQDADGKPVGTLYAFSLATDPVFGEADSAVIQALAQVIGPCLDGPRPASGHPAPRLLPQTPGSAATGALERLARPLLAALHEVTGLATIYLAEYRPEDEVQEVHYSHNALPDFAMGEGVLIPWGDTLCRRALDEGTPFVDGVLGRWGDSEIARAAGVVTYVSIPVTLPDGRMWGTLCAADPASRPSAEAHLPTLSVFASLIAAEVERTAADVTRDLLMARTRQQADTDDLTGCAHRRLVVPWIEQALHARGQDQEVLVCFVDLDDFKAVNDRHGHAVGDRVLAQLGRQLRVSSRPGDLVARFGGDEFVVVATVPVAGSGPAGQAGGAETVVSRVGEAVSLTHPLEDGTDLRVGGTVGFACGGQGASATALLAAADQDMYRRKAFDASP